MTSRSLPRSKRALFAGAALSIGVALAFSIVETTARFLERRDEIREPPPQTRLALMQPNPAGTGSFRLRPALDVVASVKGLEIPIRTNRHGMRWHDVAVTKPEAMQRIAFLGDSFTFGCWAKDIDHTFVGAFARSVDRDRFEVLNFGVGGYGLDDMELQLREQVIAFSPDFVLLMVFTGNDFRDTYLGIHKYQLIDGVAELDPEVLAAKIPNVDRESAAFALKPAPDPSRLRRWLVRFATFRRLLPALGWDNPWLEFRYDPYFTTFPYWSQYPYPAVARNARDVTLTTLERIHAFAKARGFKLAVATVPSREQVYASKATGTFYDIDLPQAYIRTFARDRDIPFLDLLRKLRPYVLETGRQLYVAGDIHFNTEGHRLTAGFIHDWFFDQVARTTSRDPKALTRATIEVLEESFDEIEREVELTLRFTNVGETIWFNEESDAGWVSVALRSEPRRSPDFCEARPRHKLTKAVSPGEEHTRSLGFHIPERCTNRDWYVDLVNEGYYWFSERGTLPARVNVPLSK